MDNSFEVNTKSLGYGVDDALNRSNELMKMAVFDSGGSFDNLVLGFTFALFKETETATTEELQLVNEPVTFVFKYPDMRLDKVLADNDGRIGETVFHVVAKILEGMKKIGLDCEKKLRSEKQDGTEQS